MSRPWLLVASSLAVLVALLCSVGPGEAASGKARRSVNFTPSWGKRAAAAVKVTEAECEDPDRNARIQGLVERLRVSETE